MPYPLTEKQEKLLSLFKVAIENERQAQALYQETLLYCEDESLKRIIESFIVEESKHEKSLMKKYNEIRRTDEYKDMEE